MIEEGFQILGKFTVMKGKLKYDLLYNSLIIGLLINGVPLKMTFWCYSFKKDRTENEDILYIVTDINKGDVLMI